MNNQLVSGLLLEENGKYVSDGPHEKTEKAAVETPPGLEIDQERVFEGEKFMWRACPPGARERRPGEAIPP